MGEDTPQVHVQKPGPAPASPPRQAAALHIDLSDITTAKPSMDENENEIFSPTAPTTPDPFGRNGNSALDLDDYFVGPRDIAKHSKWPIFLQMHGSILPKMVMPLFFIGIWSTAITLITMKVWSLAVNSVLLTVLGFVVGMGLSFRSSTAYERYNDGRKFWSQLTMVSGNLGRLFWVHSRERSDDPEKRKEHLLQAMTSSNLVVAFAIALKHKLRFEPYTGYDDLTHLVSHLDTFAGVATEDDPSKSTLPRKSALKEFGEYLGVSFAESNPRKALKKANKPLGNLPVEILNYLSRAVDDLVNDGKIPIGMTQTIAYNGLVALADVLAGTDRVLTTPLPIAYSIAIAQITWVYVLLLPFQLVGPLEWVTIPATIAAAYIILGILFIGREIENPFGQDVNDLPLDMYCQQIAQEMDIIAAQSLELEGFTMDSVNNKVLYPVSSQTYTSWKMRSEARLREAIKRKPIASFESRAHHQGEAAHRAKEASIVGEKKV